jgi:hypothetical protein
VAGRKHQIYQCQSVRVWQRDQWCRVASPDHVSTISQSCNEGATSMAAASSAEIPRR